MTSEELRLEFAEQKKQKRNPAGSSAHAVCWTNRVEREESASAKAAQPWCWETSWGCSLMEQEDFATGRQGQCADRANRGRRGKADCNSEKWIMELQTGRRLAAMELNEK